MPEGSVVTPLSLLKQAIKAVPAVRYALGVGGIVAVIAIVRSFQISFQVAVLGTIVMFVLMTVLVVFSRLVGTQVASFRTPVLVLTWFSLILMMAASLALFFSVFFQWPLDLRDKPNASSGATTRAEKPPEMASQQAHPKGPTLEEIAEEEASKNEQSGDSSAVTAIVCFADNSPPTGSPFLDRFTGLRCARDEWKQAMFHWKQARALTKDPIRIVRLDGKISDDNSVLCKSDGNLKNATCKPIAKAMDIADTGAKLLSMYRQRLSQDD